MRTITWTSTRDRTGDTEAFTTLGGTRIYARAGELHGYVILIHEGVTVPFSQRIPNTSAMQRRIENALRGAEPRLRARQRELAAAVEELRSGEQNVAGAA